VMRNTLMLAAMAATIGLAGCTADNRADVRENVRGVRQQVRTAAEDARQAAENATLEARVKTALKSRKGLDADEINVEARASHVILNGDVANRAQAELAEQVALQTEGVTTVENRLMLRVPARSAPEASRTPPAEPRDTGPYLGGP